MQGVIEAALERAKVNLIDAHGEEVPTLQGEARAYRKLLKSLTEPTPMFDNRNE